MHVIGTAGHVDHGKSTLVRALTGIDPDRLAEEKARGMTIDLGFAWLTLPSGRDVSIVDVPGHERFIKNMLAGVGGIDLALLVVASDEGVMPQTREHLDILGLLDVRRGVVAVTKVDAVEEDWLALVLEETAGELRRTSLGDAPLVPVSAERGDGLPELLAALDRAIDAAPAHDERGVPRLPVDRVFTLSGHGTVVTGTLLDGALVVGQDVEVQPSGKRARVRTLQTHRHRVDEALPGTRVAVNLAGLATEDVQRGDVLSLPGWLRPSQTVDARLTLVPSAGRELEHDDPVALYVGAAEVMARVRLLDRDVLEPGQSGLVQFRLGSPVAIRRGDRFIIRRPSPPATIGGGTILDAVARHHRRHQAPVIEALSAIESGSARDVVLELLKSRRVWDVAELAVRSQMARLDVEAVLKGLAADGGVRLFGGWAVASEAWREIERRVADVLGAFHRQHPLRSGMPREELRTQLNLPGRPWTDMLDELVREGAVELRGLLVAKSGVAPALSDRQRQASDALLAALRASPFSPPSMGELPAADDAELVAYLVEQGIVVRIGDDLLFTAEAYEEMLARVVASLEAVGRITVAGVRDTLGTSRRYALALLEHLDAERITRRIGDERVLVRGAGRAKGADPAAARAVEAPKQGPVEAAQP